MKKKKIRKFPGAFFLGKMLQTMKLAVLLVVLATLQLSAKGYSQETITLKMHDATFAEVVKEIERQTQVTFLYNHDYVRELSHIDVDYVNLGLPAVLEHLLKGTALEYKLVDNTVVITAKRTQEQTRREVRDIRGKVTDKQGDPLPGVTIVIKGTKLGVATDVDGNFSIQTFAAGPLVLECTFVGMRNKEVDVVDGRVLTIVMEEEAEEMEEVVVTGYFTKSKESFTGSEVTIPTEELKKVGALNILQALNAFDPSIRLSESLTNGSNPNFIQDITIRREHGFDLRANADDALTNPNAPLYILDGV
ncbi:MAG: carboxypeptidase-like regulatory domain-containing protein, partial [Odoribacter sp.]|nr:carboxypeptidase-like regulatory domain-containing protein [Odoribacter sp.]